jgi:hypothetical protein
MDEERDEEGQNENAEPVLREGVKRIVVSRERTPRSPQWQRSWWRTLVRYNRRLTELAGRRAPEDATAGVEETDDA